MKKIALCLLALLALAGCGGREREATAADAIASAHIHNGLLELRLASNPSTGYMWTWTQEGEGRVAEQSRSFESSVAEGDAPRDGAGGTELFYFEAEAVGEGALIFSYARFWDKDISPAETYRAEFRVSERDGALRIELR